MIRSMTGYGSAEIERSGQRLSGEVRSVNHRFCEVSIRGPKVALAFEDQIRSRHPKIKIIQPQPGKSVTV